MIIAVASGKGGTGKTTVSVNLARVARQSVQLLDCDVEEPNAHLFLTGELKAREEVRVPVPEADETLCDGCGECSSFCRYRSLAVIDKSVLTFPELCHGCGGCIRVCPKGALSEKGHRIGVIETFQTGHVSLVHGCLDVGVAMAPPLIRAVKSRIRKGCISILDAPPGTSCPVVASVRKTDAVLLVTEPTPFGLNDLALAVGMVRALGVPFGVLINRSDIGDASVREYCAREGIPVLMEIPEDRRIAEAYSRGAPAIAAVPELSPRFRELADRLAGLAACHPAEVPA